MKYKKHKVIKLKIKQELKKTDMGHFLAQHHDLMSVFYVKDVKSVSKIEGR